MSGGLLSDPGLVGQGLGAVFPVVVVGIVADLLVQLLLHIKIVGMADYMGEREIRDAIFSATEQVINECKIKGGC